MSISLNHKTMSTIPCLNPLKLLFMAKSNYYDFQLALMHQYPEIVYVPGIFSSYQVFHPEFIQHILQHNAKNYDKSEYTYQTISLGLGKSLLTESNYHCWRDLRRQLQPVFHHQTLVQHTECIVQKTEQHIQHWLTACKNNQGIDLHHELKRLTADVASTLLAGPELSAHVEEILDFGAATNYFMASGLIRFQWLPGKAKQHFRQSYTTLKNCLQRIITSRRQCQTHRADFLSALLKVEPALDDTEIIDQLITFLVAGYESTATALSFGCYELSQAPHVLDQLQQELHHVLGQHSIHQDHLTTLTYTQQVVAEILRLYPSIWLFGRRAIADDTLGEYRIKAGHQLLISPYVVHRNPHYWPNPSNFDPTRFSAEAIKTRPKGAYIPFGSGPRTCIGMPLALLQSRIIIASIFRHVSLEFIETPKLRALTTLVPEKPMKVNLYS